MNKEGDINLQSFLKQFTTTSQNEKDKKAVSDEAFTLIAAILKLTEEIKLVRIKL